MQKQAWIHSLTPPALGAVCVLLRWLQNMNAFEKDTGLAVPHHPLSIILAIALIGAAVALFMMNRTLRSVRVEEDPEKALANVPAPLSAAIIAAGVVAAGGTVLAFFTGAGIAEKLTALLGLLSVPGLLFLPFLSHWGGFGAFLSLSPVSFFSVWFVVAYREYAKDPVLWNYAPLMLAIAASLYAVYRISAYFHYRAQPMKTLYACSLATVLNITVLMDTALGAGRLILAGWALGFAVINGMLLLNMTEVLPEYDVDDEYR